MIFACKRGILKNADYARAGKAIPPARLADRAVDTRPKAALQPWSVSGYLLSKLHSHPPIPAPSDPARSL